MMNVNCSLNLFVFAAWVILYLVFLRNFDYIQALLWNNYKDGKKDEPPRPRRTRQNAHVRQD